MRINDGGIDDKRMGKLHGSEIGVERMAYEDGARVNEVNDPLLYVAQGCSDWVYHFLGDARESRKMRSVMRHKRTKAY